LLDVGLIVYKLGYDTNLEASKPNFHINLKLIMI
jgi:hypothetical protein